MDNLLQRCADKIRGVLSCFDRLVVTGTLTGVCHADGMAHYLFSRGIRLFDFPKFALPLRDQIRDNAEQIAKQSGLEIEYIRSNKLFRKDERVQEVIKHRGDHPGLVHVFSALELCTEFRPHYSKETGKSSLKAKEGKCLHYYFYFIDEIFGLCFMRVPTWAPFRLQFYCNGHNYLANRLRQEDVPFTMLDNAFDTIDDFPRAQAVANEFSPQSLRELLEASARKYCPPSQIFTDQYPQPYHWSIMQAEYATDIIFTSSDDLCRLYEPLVRTAIHAVKAANVATFLGRKIHPLYQGEVGNDFHTRIEGTRIKHHMGPASIKMYDKGGVILRIETTVNDVTFFKHYRQVEHRDGTTGMQYAPMQKTIYSLSPLRELMLAANQRYIAFLSSLSDPSPGLEKVEQLSRPASRDGRTYRGFNLFESKDLDLFLAMLDGKWQISGFQNAGLRQLIPYTSGPQLSRLLRRLREHHLIKKVGRTYKYYLTTLGRDVALAALKLRELVVIPSLAEQPSS